MSSNKIELRPFDPFLPAHLKARKRAKQLCQSLNALASNKIKERSQLQQELFAQVQQAFIEPHFFCDYGYNIFLGEEFFANHNCIFLDAAPIHIGNKVLLGPNVHLYTTTHPLNAEQRATGQQLIAPIKMGNNVWIGGNSVVMPGVEIGDNTVIGAGSVVTETLPANVIAVGSPCKVARSLLEN